MSGLDAEFRVLRPGGFRVDVSVSIDAGATAALVGPNGAGKSTVVAVIAGLIPIDSGRIALGERVIDDPAAGVFVPPASRRVGVVFQDRLLFPHLTVADNVEFGLRSRGSAAGEARRRAGEWLERLDLAALSDRRPGDLSGGQAQRVALARALVTEPAVLVLDEPLTALDVSARALLRGLLAHHLAEFDGPRLLVTHDPSEAFLLADRIHVMEKGVVTQSGSADQVRLRPRTPYAADLAGSNLFSGRAAGGRIVVGGHGLQAADRVADGPVLITIPSRAISVHRERPVGSPRNTWQTRVHAVEHLGERVRLQVGEPLPLTVEITGASYEELGLRPAAAIWVAIKATEVGVEADAEPSSP